MLERHLGALADAGGADALGRRHGFHKRENRDYTFWAGVTFWQANLLDD